MALAQLALAIALQVSREIHVLLQREVVCLLVVPMVLVIHSLTDASVQEVPQALPAWGQ